MNTETQLHSQVLAAINTVLSGHAFDGGQLADAAIEAHRAFQYRRLDILEAALKAIAERKTLGELSDAGEDNEDDFEGDYDAIIHAARSAVDTLP